MLFRSKSYCDDARMVTSAHSSDAELRGPLSQEVFDFFALLKLQLPDDAISVFANTSIDFMRLDRRSQRMATVFAQFNDSARNFCINKYVRIADKFCCDYRNNALPMSLMGHKPTNRARLKSGRCLLCT